MAPAPVRTLNAPAEVEGAAALERNNVAGDASKGGVSSNTIPVDGSAPMESTSSTNSTAPAPASAVPYTKAARSSGNRPSVPRGPSRRQIMKLLPEDLRSELATAGLDDQLEGLCEYFCSLPGPQDAAALQGHISSSSTNGNNADKSIRSASIGSSAGSSSSSGSASAGNDVAMSGRSSARRRSSSSSSSGGGNSGEASKLADHNALDEEHDPGSASGSSFTTVMARVVSDYLSDRRITPRAPEWKLCRRVLASVNPLWRIARTHVPAGPDGRLEAVSQLLARASEESVARLQELGLAPDEIASAVATFEALDPPCKLDDFRQAHGGNFTESDMMALSALSATTSHSYVDGPVPSFKLVLKLKLSGVLASVRGDISPNSLLGKALRTLCADVNSHWSLDRGTDRGPDRTFDQEPDPVPKRATINSDVEKKPPVSTKQKAPSDASGSVHKTKARVGGSHNYKGVSACSRVNQRYASRISVNGNIKFLGHFNTAEEAARRWDQEALRLGRTGLNFPANGKPSNHGVSTGSKDGGGRGSATINDGIDDEHHDDGRYEERNYLQPCILSPPVPAPVAGPQALERPFFEKPEYMERIGESGNDKHAVDAAGVEAIDNGSNRSIGKAAQMALLEAPVLNTLGGLPHPSSVHSNTSSSKYKLNHDEANHDVSSQVGAPDLLQPWPPTHSRVADGRWWTAAGLFTHTIAPAAARTLLGIVPASSDGNRSHDISRSSSKSNSSSHSNSSDPSSSGGQPTTQEFMPAVARSIDPAYALPSLGPSWLLSRARPAPVLHQPSTLLGDRRLKKNSDANAPNFRGYSEKEFRDQWVDSAPFLDQRVISFAKKRNLCPRTSFRFATPNDADALVRINKVNARYLLADYQASTRAKNDFILVAVNQHGIVTGFVQYYFQHFAPCYADDKRNKKGNGKSNGGRSGSSLRPTPKPVAYVATLQTAKPSSHAEYLAAKSSNVTQPPSTDAAAGTDTGDAASADHGKASSLMEGAEARTGVVLMALAQAHAHRDGKHFLCCDSTSDAVPFYRRFFGMESCLPAQDHPYVPMYIELTKLQPPDLLRPLAQPLHLPKPQHATLRALCRLSPPTESQPDAPLIPKSLSSSSSSASSSPKSSSKSSPNLSSSLSLGKYAEPSELELSASLSSFPSSLSPPAPPLPLSSALSPASFTTTGLPPSTLPFVEARALVRSEKLLRGQWPQWRDDPTKRPSDVPAQPDAVYAQRGWASWGDWLGLSQKSIDRSGSGDRFNNSSRSNSSPTIGSSSQQRALFGPVLDQDKDEEREVCKRSREALDEHLNGASGWRTQGPLKLRLAISPAPEKKSDQNHDEHQDQTQPQQDSKKSSMPRATVTLLSLGGDQPSNSEVSSGPSPGVAPEFQLLPSMRVLKTFEVIDRHASKADCDSVVVDDDDDINETTKEQDIGSTSTCKNAAIEELTKWPRSRNGSGNGNELCDEKRRSVKRGQDIEGGNDESSDDEDDLTNLRRHDLSVLAEIKRAQEKLAWLEDQSLERAAGLLSRVNDEASIVSSQQRTETLAAMVDANQRYNSLAQEASASLAAQRQRLEEDMEANCAVCSQGEVHVGQQIVFCEYCNVAVHQKCYGVGSIPDEDWFCAPCTATVSVVRRAAVAAATEKALQPPVACALCPARYRGAVFPTDDPAVWVHSLCADLAQVAIQPMVAIVQQQEGGGGDSSSSNSPSLAHVQSPHALGCSSRAIRAVQKAASQAAEAAATAATAAEAATADSGAGAGAGAAAAAAEPAASSSSPLASSSSPSSSSSGHPLLGHFRGSRAIERFDPSSGAALEVYRTGTECAAALGLTPTQVSVIAHGKKRGTVYDRPLRFQTQTSPSSSSLPSSSSFGCVFCHTNVGALVTCADVSCQIRLHGTCATVAGCDVALVDETAAPQALDSLSKKTSPLIPSTNELSPAAAAAAVAAVADPVVDGVPHTLDSEAVAKPATVESSRKDAGHRRWRVHCAKHTTGLPARSRSAIPRGPNNMHGRGKRRRGASNGKDNSSNGSSIIGKRALFNGNGKGSTNPDNLSDMHDGGSHSPGGPVLDKTNARRCHMCQALTSQPTAVCSSRLFVSAYRNRKCTMAFCAEHIAAMGENPTEVCEAAAEGGVGWDCYRCRNLCRCFVCSRNKKVPPMAATNNHLQEASNGLPPNPKASVVRQTVNVPLTAPVTNTLPNASITASSSSSSHSNSNNSSYRSLVKNTSKRTRREDEGRGGSLESFQMSCHGARCAVCADFRDGPNISTDNDDGHGSSSDHSTTSAEMPNPMMACRGCHAFVHYNCLNAATKPVAGPSMSLRLFLCNVCEDTSGMTSGTVEATSDAHVVQELSSVNKGAHQVNSDEVDRNCYVCPAPGGFRFRVRMPPPDESEQQQPSYSAGQIMYIHGFCMRALLDRATPKEANQEESNGLAPETDFCCVCGDQSGVKFPCQADGQSTHSGDGNDGSNIGDSNIGGSNACGGTSNGRSNSRCAHSFHPMCALQAALAPGCCHVHSSRDSLAQRIKHLLQFSSPEDSDSLSNDHNGGASSPNGSDVTNRKNCVEPGSIHVETKEAIHVVSAAQYHYAEAILQELLWAHLPKGESGHVSSSFEALSCALRTFSTGDSSNMSSSLTNHLSAVMIEVAVSAAQNAAADHGRAVALGSAVVLSASEASLAVKILASVFEQTCLKAIEPLVPTPSRSAPHVLMCGLCHVVDDLSSLNLCPGRYCGGNENNNHNTYLKHPNQSLEGTNGDGFYLQCSSEQGEDEYGANKKRRISEDGDSGSIATEKRHAEDKQKYDEQPACVAVFHPACAGWVKHPGGSNALVRQGVAARCDASGQPIAALRCPPCAQAPLLYSSSSSSGNGDDQQQAKQAQNEHESQQQQPHELSLQQPQLARPICELNKFDWI